MFGITASVLYLYFYFSVIFNALISPLVCLTNVHHYIIAKNLAILPRGPPTAGAHCHGTNGTMVNPALRVI